MNLIRRIISFLIACFLLCGLGTLSLGVTAVRSQIAQDDITEARLFIAAEPEHTHAFKDVIVAATCTHNGYVYYACSGCDETYMRYHVAPTGHAYSQEIVKEPTCTEPGYTKNICHCGNVQEETSIPAWGHSYEYYSTTAPTTTTEGWEIYVCTRCGKEEKTTLPKLSAADTDMCCESLLGKVLPNAPYSEFSKLVMECWGSEMTYEESRTADKLPHPGTLDNPYKVIEEWEIPYAYITQEFSSTTTIISRLGTRTLAFRCWAEEAKYEEMRTIYARVYEILAELNIDETVTKKEAVTRINNWICQQKSYNFEFIQDRSLRDDSLYYSVFADNGICRNYALAFQVICLGAGIECHYYKAKTMAHAWNKVYFSDGTFLWVDVCWNDASEYNRYYAPYLLITTEQLMRDHTL